MSRGPEPYACASSRICRTRWRPSRLGVALERSMTMLTSGATNRSRVRSLGTAAHDPTARRRLSARLGQRLAQIVRPGPFRSARFDALRAELAHILARRASERGGTLYWNGFRDTANGIRTRVTAVRGRRPSPLDDGGSCEMSRLAKEAATEPVTRPTKRLAHPPARAISSALGHADVAELVDAHGSGPCRSNPVEVRVLSSAFRQG